MAPIFPPPLRTSARALTPALFLAGFALALAPLAPAQQAEWGPWQVIGPFDHSKGSADNSPSHAPESALSRMEADEPWEELAEIHRGKEKREVRWWPLLAAGHEAERRVDVGKVDFLQVFPRPADAQDWSENAVAYLYRTVTVSGSRRLDLNLGSDDGLRVWFDGELVLDSNTARGVNLRDDRLLLQVEPGLHHLLVKVNNGGGAWGFRMAEYSRPAQDAINAAIERGVEFLLSRQMIDGSWGEYQPQYRNGETALVAYTLLKSGLPPRHPAVLRAFAYLREEPPTRTYSIGCQMMALAAAKDPDYDEWIEELAVDLASWQDRMRGAWAYPEGELDLSNTQYAALGLRAAEQVGLEVPDRVWSRLLDGVLDHQDRIDKVDAVPGAKAVSGSRMPVAGFAYRRGNPKSPTGSMTVAGLATLEVCRQALDPGPDSALAKKITKAQDLALNWLARHFIVRGNPGRTGHHHYYLYGLERAGSLLGTETVGVHEWYWEGAEVLLEQQRENGSWVDEWGARPETITCYALLFLKRATAAATTGEGKSASRSVRSPAGSGPLSLVVIPGEPTVLFVEKVELPEGSEPLDEVRYRVRRPGEPWEEVAAGRVRKGADPMAPSRYSARHSFPSPGIWEVQALADGPDGAELASGVATFELEVGVLQASLRYAADAGRNRLPRARPEVTASSGNGNAAADNLYGSAWVCAREDAAPTLSFKLKRGVRTKRIQFTHRETRPVGDTGYARPARVELRINRDSEPILLDIDPRTMHKTVYELEEPRTISRLEVRVVAVGGGELGEAPVGFAEIELHPPAR
jgi:hypothetical protein